MAPAAAVIDEKTRIPLGWAAAILVSLAGAIGGYAVNHYRLGAVEHSVEQLQQDRKADVELRERLVRVEENTKSTKELLERLLERSQK